jgi:hypothetical protein
MKRKWLNHVAILAALGAGTVCSTAFADGKKGGRTFGGSARNFSGGASQMNISRSTRTLGNGIQGGVQLHNQSFSPNLSSSVKRLPVQGNKSGRCRATSTAANSDKG